MLLADEEWSAKSDRWIANRCGVSHPFVQKARGELVTLTSSESKPSSDSRLGQDGKTRKLPERRPHANAEQPTRQPPQAPPEARAAVAPSESKPLAPPAARQEPPSEPLDEECASFAAEPPQPPEQPRPRMRQMTIEDRIGAKLAGTVAVAIHLASSRKGAEMAALQITRIRKDGSRFTMENEHEHISQIGTATRWWAVHEAILDIETNLNSFYTLVNGRRAEVVVVDGATKRYLRTKADDVLTDNLLALPVVP